MLVVDAPTSTAHGNHALFEGVAMDRSPGERAGDRARVGLIDLLDMAAAAGCLPFRRALLCIPAARIDWSEALSEPVEAAFWRAIDRPRLVERWRSDESPGGNPDPDRAAGTRRWLGGGVTAILTRS